MKNLIFAAAAGLSVLANAETLIERLAPDVCRVRAVVDGKPSESLLNRYGIVERLSPERIDALPGNFPKPVFAKKDDGYEIVLPLAEGESLYGLGDVDRMTLDRRGRGYRIRVENVTSYIPIPMILSSRGYGILVNETRATDWDVGKTRSDRLTVSCAAGVPDVYVFVGRGYRELLEAYTRLTGRPKLLPAFAYGFSYVANEWIDQHEAVEEAYRFRSLDFPCDVFGLEPGWMEYFYDSTTKKNWNRRFKFSGWQIDQGCDRSRSWLAGLEKMGFKLSLWLCMNYDLFVYEEECATTGPRPGPKYVAAKDISDQGFEDTRISDSKFEGLDKTKIDGVKMLESEVKNARRDVTQRPDGLTGLKQDGKEPWFWHLKKFVNRGARCFKLDGGWQVCEFPDRVWAGKYPDAVAHNLYPVVYAKQMCEGFEHYTDRRAMVYSAGGFAGVQRYVATWAGDTGGGVKTLVSTLNLGVSGHPNQSCDLEIANLPSLHYGVFAPWTQQNNWDYFQQPWYRDKAELAVIRKYIELRYRLFPYIYTMAEEAARTGWPIARPLAFVYPGVKDYANETGTYMFGDSLLVSAFADHTVIPAGDWYEWRTGEKVTGPCVRPVAVSDDWGGGLYVKAGAIIPTWPLKQHLDRGWNRTVELHVWPGPDSTFTLYEDDGDSLGYLKGEGARTEIRRIGGKVEIGETRGSFPGMPTGPRDFKIINEPKGKER